jgi:hypothetical protein
LQFFETAGGPVNFADSYTGQPLGRCRAGDSVSRDIVEGDRSDFGIGEAIVQLLRLDPPVERRHDNARELASPVYAGHFEPVLQDHRKTVAAPEAELGQPACDACYLLIPGGIAEPPLAVDDRGRVGAAFNRSKKRSTQIKHRKSIICRPRVEASGRFRFDAAPDRR